jgi:isoquinoline 1-oxidoreductase beta subunit
MPCNPSIPPGFWRAASNLNQNTIPSLECFIDGNCARDQADPLQFRRKLMANHPKHLAVLNAAAERAGGHAPPPKVSIAACSTMGFGEAMSPRVLRSRSAQRCAPDSRIVAATDSGHAVNPGRSRPRSKAALCTVFGGATANARTRRIRELIAYQVLRMNETPKVVETIVMPSGGLGGSEPTIALRHRRC